MRTPIHGEAGIGYEIRRGFDLPPVNFDAEEAEAVALGLALLARAGDAGLTHAVRCAARGLFDAAPLGALPLASTRGAAPPQYVDLPEIGRAIRNETVPEIDHVDRDGRASARSVGPLGLVHHALSLLVALFTVTFALLMAAAERAARPAQVS